MAPHTALRRGRARRLPAFPLGTARRLADRPPDNWRSLSFEEQVRAWHWPEADTDAAEMAAVAYALTQEVPAVLAPLSPVTIKFMARSEAEGSGRPAAGLD